jgi:hypothetical protein
MEDFILELPDDVSRYILGFLDVPTLVQKKSNISLVAKVVHRHD